MEERFLGKNGAGAQGDGDEELGIFFGWGVSVDEVRHELGGRWGISMYGVCAR